MGRRKIFRAGGAEAARWAAEALRAIVFGSLLVGLSAVGTRAQSGESTTWTVSIVLPPRLVAGQPATLAVLGVDGRLAEGVTVEIGKDQRVKTDKTGRALFTAPTDAPVLIADAAGDSAAALVDAAAAGASERAAQVPPVVSQLDQFSICGGGFGGAADANVVSINDERVFVLASSPECIVVLASPRALPGPAKISIETPAGQWSAATTLASLHFDPPLPPLVPDKRSQLTLHVQGSDQALRVWVENETPGVLRFLRGDRQELLTSGGPQNSAEIEVQAVSTGDFQFHGRILAAPDAGVARRYLAAAETMAPKDLQHATKSLADRLTHHPDDTQRVWREAEGILATTMAGDYRTLLESAAAALQ
ncbi:MAG: hypothetical protein WA192_06665 [Candidatus Acidiferrales bacterium]